MPPLYEDFFNNFESSKMNTPYKLEHSTINELDRENCVS